MKESTIPSTSMRVLVTGAGHGIGHAVARNFLGLGADVTLHMHSVYAEDGPRELGEQAHIVSGDLTVEKDTHRVISEAVMAMGGLDAVVANVGGLIDRVPLSEMGLDHWQKVIDVNLTSVMLTMKYSLEHLAQSEFGSLVTVSSLAAHNGGGPGAAAYSAAKAAVVGLTKAAAKEFAPDGVRVNSVAPGFIGSTKFHDTFSTVEAQRNMVENTALKRAGTPDDVANLIAFLVSPAASFITGETVDINGGQWFR